MINRLTRLSAVALVAVVFAGCADATPTDITPSEARFANGQNGAAVDGPTIVDIATGNPDFSILVEALTAADLVEALNGKRQFTVFAPTNDAFAALLGVLGVTKEELLADEDLLQQVLLYHVAPGERFSGDVLDSDQIRTLQGGFVFPLAEGGEFFIVDGDDRTPNARLLAAEGLIDIDASNGVVHVIDQVLVPGAGSTPGDDDDEGDDEGDDDEEEPTIAELVASYATADEGAEFTVLYDLIQTAGLVDALNGDRELTVFAPTDAAVERLIDVLVAELGEDEANAILTDPDAIRDILLYHVLPGERESEDVLEAETLVTLNGGALTPLANADGVFIVDGSALTEDAQLQIDAGLIDIEADNGVVHVIDEVLLPGS